MTNTTKAIILGCSLAAVTSATAEIETSVHTGYHSIYEFRGNDLGENLIETGVDLSTELSEGLTLSGGAWYGDADGYDDELDLYVGLTQSMGAFDVSVGYTYYAYPGARNTDTSEVYAGLSTELSCGTGLSATYFQDLDLDSGYLDVAANKSFTLSPCVSLDLTVGAAYSNGYNSHTSASFTSLDGFSHYYASVAAPWKVGKGFTITPYAKYVGADSSLANDGNSSEDLFFGGVSLSYGF